MIVFLIDHQEKRFINIIMLTLRLYHLVNNVSWSVGVVSCTDCKAPRGKFVILGYTNKIDLICVFPKWFAKLQNSLAHKMRLDAKISNANQVIM